MQAKANIQQFICQVRKKARLTQKQFASRLGELFSTISRWENGRTTLSPLAMQKIEQYAQQLGAIAGNIEIFCQVESDTKNVDRFHEFSQSLTPKEH